MAWKEVTVQHQHFVEEIDYDEIERIEVRISLFKQGTCLVKPYKLLQLSSRQYVRLIKACQTFF